MNSITEMDLGTNLFIQENLRNPLLDSLMKTYTVLNNAGILAIGIVVFFVLVKGLREVGVVMALSLATQAVFNNILLKPLVARMRPYEYSEKVVLLVGKANDFSFPSGHTGSAFAIAVVVCLMLPRKYGIVALGMAVLMGYSRLYVGIHYPTDVLGGALLGVITSYLSYFVFRRYEARKELN